MREKVDGTMSRRVKRETVEIERKDREGNKVSWAEERVKWGYTISCTIRKIWYRKRDQQTMRTRDAGQNNRTTDIIKGREEVEGENRRRDPLKGIRHKMRWKKGMHDFSLRVVRGLKSS